MVIGEIVIPIRTINETTNKNILKKKKKKIRMLHAYSIIFIRYIINKTIKLSQ